MPKKIIKEQETATTTYAKFFAEPLESGYGHTLGNALRRVLLASLEGAAISSVKIEGVFHEFCSMPGVVEDVTDIILNLKKTLFRMYSREPKKVFLKMKGPGEVKASNIVCDQNIEVVNPSNYICTLSDDGKIEAEFEVTIGRGFRPADWKEKKEEIVGLIPVDCLFSPVKRVNYSVENVRVGKKVDFEKLVLEIWTDERIIPDEALWQASAILRHHLDVFVNYNIQPIEFEEEKIVVDKDREELKKKLNMSVNEIELSVRAANCLNNANILTVGELAQKTPAEMLKYRNFGKKSLQEIENKLKELGLSLGVKIDSDLLPSRQQQDAPKINEK
jgi:DNA-directed RNA polymerase subunit alpha